MVLDPQVSPEEIKSREVELGLTVGLLLRQSFLNSGATDIVFCDCSAQHLKQQLCSTLVATQWRGDTALTFLLFWRRSTASLVFRVAACG